MSSLTQDVKFCYEHCSLDGMSKYFALKKDEENITEQYPWSRLQKSLVISYFM
jgi:hypothetical protein